MRLHILSASARHGAGFAVIALIVSFMAVSCRSGREASSGTHYESTGEALGQQRLKELFGNFEAAYTPWEEVKVPVTLNLQSPKRFSVGGTLTMVRDKSINLSLRFFGMEVASVMVTEDSVFAAYKLEKIYFAESIRDLLGGFPATVGNVQDLLLGRPFVLGERGISLSDCSLEGNSATWTLSPKQSPFGMSYDFTVDTPTGNVELLTVNLPSRAPIQADYSDFAESATGPMAGNTRVTTTVGNGKFSGELDLNPRKAEWGRGYAKGWTVPRGYKRVHAADIFKKIKDKS